MGRLVVKGSSKYFELASAVVSGVPFTMAAWYRPTTSNASGTVVGLGRTVTAGEYFALGVTAAAKPFFEVSHPTGSTFDATHATSVTNGAWGHLAAVATSATSRNVFFNGVAGTSNTTSAIPASMNRTNIGALISNTAVSFADGDIAEVAIWNVALTTDEITSLSKGMSPALIRPTSLKLYAPMTEPGTGNTPDLIGGVPLTAVATPATSTDHPPIIYPRQPMVVPAAATGGATLTVTVSDSSTVTDSTDVTRDNARDVTVSDASTVTENVVKELTISANVNDSSTVTENILRRLDASLNVSDASSITENTVVRLEANVNVSDSSTITETAVPFVTPLYVNVNDASAVTENIVMLETSSVNVNDASAITENVLRLETIAVNTSDATGVTENTQFNEVSFINVNDSSGITENAVVQIPSGSDLSVTVSDSSAITENVLRLETAFIAVSDSSGVTENVLRRLDASLSVSDTSGITENIGRTLEGNVAVSDASAITENTTFLNTESITVSDAAGVTDTVSLYPNPLLISVSDSSTITESRFVNAGGAVATKPPGVIFLTDGRVAVRMGGNVYQPL